MKKHIKTALVILFMIATVQACYTGSASIKYQSQNKTIEYERITDNESRA